MFGWLLLVGGLWFAGYALSWPLIWILTSRFDGRERDRNGPLFRYQLVVAAVIGSIFFIIIGIAVDWNF